MMFRRLLHILPMIAGMFMFSPIIISPLAGENKWVSNERCDIIKIEQARSYQ